MYQARDIYDLMTKINDETCYMVYEKDNRNQIKIGIRFISSLINSAHQKKDFFLVAICDAMLVGYIAGVRGRFETNNNLVQFEVAVLEKYQNMGIATTFIHLLEIWAENQGLEILELNVIENNQKAARLYKKLGYEIKNRTISDVKINGLNQYELNMRKNIKFKK